MTTTVINKYKEKGDISIMRPGPWGNPFIVGKDGSRAEVIANFRYWYKTSTDPRAVWMRNHIHELKDKQLECCCKPKICHGDVLAEAADKTYG